MRVCEACRTDDPFFVFLIAGCRQITTVAIWSVMSEGPGTAIKVNHLGFPHVVGPKIYMCGD